MPGDEHARRTSQEGKSRWEKPWSEREPQTLEPEQVERVKQSQSYSGHITLSVCDNCGDNKGPLRETDAVRLLPPRIRKEWWCMNCVTSGPVLRRLRNILPKEHDYE